MATVMLTTGTEASSPANTVPIAGPTSASPLLTAPATDAGRVAERHMQAVD